MDCPQCGREFLDSDIDKTDFIAVCRYCYGVLDLKAVPGARKRLNIPEKKIKDRAAQGELTEK